MNSMIVVSFIIDIMKNILKLLRLIIIIYQYRRYRLKDLSLSVNGNIKYDNYFKFVCFNVFILCIIF